VHSDWGIALADGDTLSHVFVKETRGLKSALSHFTVTLVSPPHLFRKKTSIYDALKGLRMFVLLQTSATLPYSSVCVFPTLSAAAPHYIHSFSLSKMAPHLSPDAIEATPG